jgi:hypothetical protein
MCESIAQVLAARAANKPRGYTDCDFEEDEKRDNLKAPKDLVVRDAAGQEINPGTILAGLNGRGCI